MRFGVLGPLAVWTDDGAPVAVPGIKVRALLADLLLHEGRPVPADRLIDDLWGEALPGNPAGALSAKVSQLRRVLEDAEPGARALVESRPAGYSLQAGERAPVDALRFAELVGQARDAASAEKAGLLAAALRMWRGPAFADFADEPFTRAAIARLEEQRLTALEDHAEVRLTLGEHGALVGELADALAAHPLRERLRAAHMRALYRSGRQSEALDSFEELRSRLADELGLDPSAELVTLQRAVLAQDLALDAPAAPAPEPRPRTNLPVPPTELIGRADAVAEIAGLFGTERLVTLTGPGGVGKTRLSIAVAGELAEGFPGGVRMVELAAFDHAAAPELIDGIMTALDLRDAAEPGAPLERLAAALAGRGVLLLLDNCEHVVDAVAEITDRLLAAAPDLRVLATSREPLGLPGEVVWSVPPLTVPERDAAPDPGELARSSAVRLFTARASAAARGFRLDEANAADVAVLCRRLDGIPLALELAATRVRALGVPGLVSRLDDRFRLLATGHRGAPPRQQTLLAMIDWSWELLSAAERTVLRRLAAHADGCTLEAAEHVTGDGLDALDLLVRLVDRSLVVMTERPGRAPRYRLLESVAAYCADRLQDAGEEAAVRQRHREHYIVLAERAEPHLYGHDQAHWLDLLDAESANLRAALDGASGPDALRLANALTWYWFLRGRWSEARRALTAALDLTTAPSPERARALAYRACFVVLQGDGTGWPARRAEALAALDGPGDPVVRARARWFLVYAGSELDDVDDAAALLAPTLAEFEALGDEWGTAAALAMRAHHGHARGEPAAIERDADAATRIFTRLGDRWGRLQASEWLAGHAELVGDYGRAERLGREGVRMAEELRLWPHVAVGLGWLGWVALLRGDFPAARDLFAQALEQGTEQGNRGAMFFGELGLGLVARRLGDLDEADDRLRAMLKSVPPPNDDTPPPLFLPLIQVALGYIAEERGDAATALAYQRDALAVAITLDAPRDKAFALEGLAGAVSLAGDHAHAARLLGGAAEIRRAAGIPAGPSEQADVERVTARVRTGLDEDVFAAEAARGAARTAEEHLAELPTA
ncbi:BTAD domain-containing putative transcriptional regulator [Actinomadura hibisca]|uniref:BTAD domain-containing putative transcriptional regulator n=1 Tax=Actinomadura hibisca TaxID=68565 RepID=UPI0008339AFC|nr:BTAD domain-containing putative transcriptional regulator [Actinomadura hibisca]